MAETIRTDVWFYWQCPYCKSIIHGRNRTCKNCGSPIPNNVKYLPPDDSLVQEAIRNKTVLLDEEDKHIDEKGNIVEKVDIKTDKIRHIPNWVCEYCGYQNFVNEDKPMEEQFCEGCGSPRTNKNYFDFHKENDERLKENNTTNDTNADIDAYERRERRMKEQAEDEEEHSHLKRDDTTHDNIKRTQRYLNEERRKFDFSQVTGSFIYLGLLLIIVIPLLILSIPVTRHATVESFGWERQIAVDEYILCHEKGWSVPSGGIITSEKQEIHHYNEVFDHYETKTKTVSYQVFDGYDTHYEDKGNGQGVMVQTPRYRTEYKTETYQEAVYRDEPVYQTRYYYDIGRWKIVDYLKTNGRDREPYWAETDLLKDIDYPNYGDRTQGSRSSVYYAIIKDEEDNLQKKEYTYTEWMELNIGDTIEYKSRLFSHKPIN